MEYKIEDIKELDIAYMRRTGPYGQENSTLMEKMKNWARTKNIMNESIFYGIAQDNLDTPPEKCRYDVCITINDKKYLDNEVLAGKLIGGKNAVFEVGHTKEDIQNFWLNFPKYLIKNKLQIDINRRIMERYQKEKIEKGKCEFCVPIL